jgi:hypothetical protein
MHQPCDADVAMGMERAIDDGRHHDRVHELPDAETAAEVHTRGAGDDHRVHCSTRGFAHE